MRRPTAPRFALVLTLALVSALVSGLVACKGAASGAKPQTMQATDLLEVIGTDAAPLILDVRSAAEYAEGHIPGAVNLPHDQMKARAEEIGTHRDQEIVLYCRSGRRSAIAAQTLAAEGFTRLRLLEGDMPGWEGAGHPVERGQ